MEHETRQSHAPPSAPAAVPAHAHPHARHHPGIDEHAGADIDNHATSPKGAVRDPLVRLVDVCKAFGDNVVLDKVSLALERGKTTVVLGPSGVGKSVMLKHIVGLLRPDSGQVWFGQERVDSMSEADLVGVRKRVGYLFQMGALFDSMTVEQNICFPLVEHARMSLAERTAQCDKVLSMVGLKGYEKKMPGDLSGGQRKRVALARAVVLEPSLVMYDEPTTGLDPVRSDVINELIITLTRELGVTSLVVTHDMNSAFKIADRLVMIHGGRLVADGAADDFRHSDDPTVKRFVEGQAEPADLELIRAGFAQRGKK